jgi:hypothetical protein
VYPVFVTSGGESLDFDTIIDDLRDTAASCPDKRSGSNTRYSMTDIVVSAFSVFFLQCPSFLDFQRTMDKKKGAHNLTSLFGVRGIPTDNHVRDVLDAVPAQSLYPLFDTVMDRLGKQGTLDEFRSIGNDLVITLDGTEYFRSTTISCPHCHVVHHRTGHVSYKHMLISPAIVKAGCKDVLALAPEFVRTSDGSTKDENEITAAKRWLKRMGKRLSPLSVTIMGDDLYAKQPFIAMVLEQELNFLCVCKPQSHKYLYESVDSYRRAGQLESFSETSWDGKERRTTTYEWLEDVPLRGTDDALSVGWVSIRVAGEDGRTIYKNAFITNHILNAESVAQVCAAGRARWKVENEDINTLKTKGYNLEHNFGHGTENLSETLATLNILAFLLHTLLDLYNARYQLLRAERGRRTRFFQELGIVACYWHHESFEAQLRFMIRQLQLPDPGG